MHAHDSVLPGVLLVTRCTSRACTGTSSSASSSHLRYIKPRMLYPQLLHRLPFDVRQKRSSHLCRGSHVHPPAHLHGSMLGASSKAISRNRQSEQAGRTALLSSRACSSMLSVCFCTLMHYIPLHQTCGITPSCRRSCRPLSSCSMMTASFSLNHSIASTVHEKCETMIAGWRGVDCTVSRRARTYMPGIKDTEWTGHGMCKCLFYGMSVPT